jgi:succinate dehydrogenase hydrophobic anchor subunit
MLGVQVVLEDYVRGRLRRFTIGLSRFAHAAAALALACALFRLVTGGAG